MHTGHMTTLWRSLNPHRQAGILSRGSCTSNRAVQISVRVRGLGMILFVLCTWFLSYNIAIRISELIYISRDEADYLNYVPPNSGSVYNIADLSEAALSTDYAALFYIAQTMLLDYLADLFVYDFPNCRRAAYICPCSDANSSDANRLISMNCR